MGLRGDFAKVRRLERNLRDMADPSGKTQADVGRGVAAAVKSIIRSQFATGEGPDGPWQKNVRGLPALVSRKLPNAFQARIDRGVVRFTAKVTRGLLVAHQEGAVIKHRTKLAAQIGGRFITDKRKQSIYKRRKSKFKAQLRHVLLSASTTVLPKRPIYPEGALPLKWQKPIEDASTVALERWQARALG